VIDEQKEEPKLHPIQSDMRILSDVQSGGATQQPLPMEILTESLLFIDANKYLDLYRTKTGKFILAALSQQADHILQTPSTRPYIAGVRVKQDPGRPL